MQSWDVEHMIDIKKELIYAGLEPEEYAAVSPDARRENQKLLPIYAAVAMAVFAGLFLLSMLGANFNENRWIYLGMLGINLGLYLCATRLMKRHPNITEPLALCFIASLYGFSFYVSLNHPGMPAVTPVALLLVIPYFFDFRPIYEVLLTLGASALYLTLSAQIKSRSLAMDDLWNMGTFAVVASFASVVQARMKYRLMHQARVNRYLSENDILTGIRNRNAFERYLNSYGERCQRNVVCVYADVNGLHDLNDTRGHEAGDTMLRAVADVIKKRFGGENSYRVGGDEFVAFRMDADPAQLRREVAEMSEEIVARGYDTSFGVAAQDRQGIHMDSLVREAETQMYVEKKRYYSEAGHDRRRR